MNSAPNKFKMSPFAIILYVFALASLIYPKDNLPTSIKLILFGIVIICFAVGGIKIIPQFFGGDELSKTIKLEILAYTQYSQFFIFIFLISLLKSFHVRLDASDGIGMYLCCVAIIQIVITVFVKRKYQ
ncbi:MAG: hypothetical protein NTX65_08145 [Ignavibacteriales bacterium]|nr:hypothetical protein [Ignavibacteriales bacterium]